MKYFEPIPCHMNIKNKVTGRLTSNQLHFYSNSDRIKNRIPNEISFSLKISLSIDMQN